LPDSDRLTTDPDSPVEPAKATEQLARAGPPEDELVGPDRGPEHVVLYWTLFIVLVGGAFVLRGNLVWDSGPSAHSVMESIATVLAFIVGGLSLVRFYSRKQATFLLIGTGFLGSAVLNLNHAVFTSSWFVAVRVANDPTLSPDGLFSWSWIAERAFLSAFLFVSLLVWRQEVREEGGYQISDKPVYAIALLLTVMNLLFFQSVPLGRSTFPTALVSRPGEFLPGLFFLLAFMGFLGKGSWRRDQFDHWLLVALMISALSQMGFMAFSKYPHDAMFDAAHLLKIASYGAILTGLLSSVYLTFTREARVLDALTESNDALAREVQVRATTERAASESGARLQEFLDNANDLIQSVARDGKILYVNSSWKRVLGYTNEELDELNLFDIVHPQHRTSLEREFRRVLGGGAPQRFNVEYVAAGGRVVTLSGSAQAQHVDGQPVATQGILRDVTEQRMAERELAESRANLGALVENTGDAIWSVNRDHELITLNSAFSLAMEARTGSEPEVGQFPGDVFAPEDVEWYQQLYDRTLSGERHVALRTDQVDGQQRYFELYANPIHSIEGVSGAVFFGKDVTARVRAEEALHIAKDEAEAANKAKSDFLANMSHELRTPLNSVIGFTNIMLKNKDGHLSEKDISFLDRVLSNGKHLLALINEVLDLAKVEAGRMELIIDDVDLAELCVETVQQLEGQAKTKDGAVELLADVPDEVARVETDSAKLKQVIINLIGNALKFTEKGSVTVRLELAPDGKTPVAISVVDTGIGIPSDRLEAIFQAFQQAEAGTSRKYGGTGLGLALSRSICLLMGYDLIVESEIDKGSTFKIVLGERAARAARATDPENEEVLFHDEEGGGSLPLTEANTPSTDARDGKSPMPRLSDFTVLVVDDEQDARVLITHHLEEFGCQVVAVESGEAALEAAREEPPDLITLDLLMPEMSGWELLEKLKADPALRRIPVVVISVVAGEGRGRLLGAADLVTKPFEREDLLRVTWRHLVRRAEGRIVLVVEDPEERKRMSESLAAKGLQVFQASDEREALDVVRVEAPDAMLLELTGPKIDGVGLLRALRGNRLHMGLPVVVLSGDRHSEEELQELDDLANGMIPKSEAGDRLDGVLDVIFPILDPLEAGG
jgi:PAS domain S-box-containing protein